MGADGASSAGRNASSQPSLEVRELEDPSSAWDDFLKDQPGATLFHRAAWQRAIVRTFGYRPQCLVASRGNRIAGVLPLFRVPTLPWGHALVSAPQAVYGGPVADSPESRDALIERAAAIGQSMGSRYIEFRNVTPLEGLPERDLYVTFRKAILPTEAENMAAIPRNQRRSIRIGIKSGLTFESGGEDLLAPFYGLYSHSVRNLGTPVFPRSLFASLLQEFGSESRIFLVRHEGRPVAGVLTFFFRDEVLPYYGGSHREAFRYAVNDFMYWSLLCHGMERGYKVFDFGRSKKGSGSYDFKRHWGFEPTPLHYQYRLVRQGSLPDLTPRNPKFSLAIEVWKRMPLWLSEKLGPAVVRYFP